MDAGALLTPEEVSELLRIPVRGVRHLVTIGELLAITLPANRLRIERAALTDFIARRRRMAKEREREKV